ncbi:N-acetylglucosamine-6-phosphate deacetylase [Frigidibacter sp. RF13]|uniref:N-acetylglucosamine-6-phosphate deacetylase n=1 Tax=Frigidibacter sp. RF13 TaxID=2997340 RepID=UPI0022704A79|nr:N-acetylglucosamine-6-phosphate deacetylase [Frigidibacter sp. RF13]MCY1125645.1 N-acetylglucosamine-6-phosphate deacetylase [Frigidibacter sp. RF13]
MTIEAKPDGWDEAAMAGQGAWILPETIFDGIWLRSGTSLFVQKGRASLKRFDGTGPVWKCGGILSPGFVDLQVNGGGGILFNNRPDAESALAIAAAHRTTGTVAILPTLITDAAEVLEAAADAVIASHGRGGIVGIHIEGPHISPARKGTHAEGHIRPLEERTFAVVARLRQRGIPVMITLAPEAVQPGQVARLVAMGVVVAIGHTDASAAAVNALLAEGAQCFTHLFNAMSQMQGREPGCVGAAINSSAYASLICDGIHVAPEMIALALRARPVPDRMYLVSDAMPTVAGPESYKLYGQDIRLDHGRLVNADGALAGAHVTMLQSVAFLAQKIGLSLETALRMAISHPARLMGLKALSAIEGRAVSDLILIRQDLSEMQFVLP